MTGALLNYTVPGQASLETVYHHLEPIFSPVTDKLHFLNQQKREKFSMKECAGCVGRSKDCLPARSGHSTDLYYYQLYFIVLLYTVLILKIRQNIL